MGIRPAADMKMRSPRSEPTLMSAGKEITIVIRRSRSPLARLSCIDERERDRVCAEALQDPVVRVGASAAAA